jgi:hypothetical protein
VCSVCRRWGERQRAGGALPLPRGLCPANQAKPDEFRLSMRLFLCMCGIDPRRTRPVGVATRVWPLKLHLLAALGALCGLGSSVHGLVGCGGWPAFLGLWHRTRRPAFADHPPPTGEAMSMKLQGAGGGRRRARKTAGACGIIHPPRKAAGGKAPQAALFTIHRVLPHRALCSLALSRLSFGQNF